MQIWHIVLLFIAGVVLAFPAAIVISAGLGALHKFFTEPATCPRCGQRALRQVTFIRATISVNGRRAPDFWSLHQCSHCKAKLKRHKEEWVEPHSSDLRYFETTGDDHAHHMRR